ncbi:MAG TPA: TonB family protein [Vicinamibacteria bacterium]|nr:TonB family protein [Vicinamibacteria bacterium]
MRALGPTLVLLGAAAAVEAAGQPPRLVRGTIGAEPWNVMSGGIAACDVTLDAHGAVAGASLVQDLPPYGAQLREAVRGWRFEPARENGRSVRARVLVIGFFRPPALSIPTPESPRYETTTAPDALPWPTHVAVPPYPANVVGSGKVVLEADVSDQGRVTSARIVAPGSPFDSAALDAARAWTFRPSARAGTAAGSRVFMVFSFVGVTP